jgi:hypothetical protein
MLVADHLGELAKATVASTCVLVVFPVMHHVTKCSQLLKAG